jgi:gluconate kinase
MLFILGPSGVGKSAFGNYLAQTHGWLHLEMDQFHCLDIHQLRHEWDLFCLQKNILPLVRTIRQRVTSANKANCILTFSSNLVLPPGLIRVCAPSIQICYLYGSTAHCINAFLRREEFLRRKLVTGQSLDVNYWIQHNRDSYTKMSTPSYEPYRVHVFTREGRHRSHADIWEEVSKATMHSKQGRAADG